MITDRVQFTDDDVSLKISFIDQTGTEVPVSDLTNILCEVKNYRIETPSLKYALYATGEYSDYIEMPQFDDNKYARLIIESDQMQTLPVGLIIIVATYLYPDENFSDDSRQITKKGMLWHLKER